MKRTVAIMFIFSLFVQYTMAETTNIQLLNKEWNLKGAESRGVKISDLYDGNKRTSIIVLNGESHTEVYDYYLSNTIDEEFDFSKVGSDSGIYLISQNTRGGEFVVIKIEELQSSYMKTIRVPIKQGTEVIIGSAYNEYVVE